MASMGPHVFACGNACADTYATTQPSRLQWGRTFLRAEIIFEVSNQGHELALQWGRTFLRAEMICARPEAAPVVELQWGRTFLRAEITPRHKARSKGASFNGAARFCVRKFAR